jgi:hypothetical protein
MSTKVELKAALPADFSGEPADAMRWIKAIKAYFALNATIYSTDDAQVLTALNKMGKGRGVSYSEMWYDRMADANIPPQRRHLLSSRKTSNPPFSPLIHKPPHDMNYPNLLRVPSDALTESTTMDFRSTSLTSKTYPPRPRSLTNEPYATSSQLASTVNSPP